jgi:uncharacterized membrane protein
MDLPIDSTWEQRGSISKRAARVTSRALARTRARFDDGRAERAEGRARGLGWFSVGLGLAQLAFPRAMARATVGGGEGGGMRALGVRELACGMALLRRPHAGWLWARVAGDVMDLALLASALTTKHGRKASGRVLGSMGAVAGVTLLDAAAAIQLARTGVATRAERQAQAMESVTVNKSPEEVFRFWRNFENLPRFMAHLASVQVRDERRSHWAARVPGGATLEWDAEITEEQPNQLIRWRALPSAELSHSGTVRFTRAPGGKGTEVHVEMHVDPPRRWLGRSAARLLARGIESQMAGDLRRFKQVMETGEVVHSDASIHPGKHPAQPSGRGAKTTNGGRR